MEKGGEKKNVFLMRLGFFLVFVFVLVLSSEVVSAAITCNSELPCAPRNMAGTSFCTSPNGEWFWYCDGCLAGYLGPVGPFSAKYCYVCDSGSDCASGVCINPGAINAYCASPTGWISAGTCTLGISETTCTANLQWGTSNAIGVEVRTGTGGLFSTSPSGNSNPTWVTLAGTTMTLTSSNGLSESDFLGASCEAGLVQSGSTCVAPCSNECTAGQWDCTGSFQGSPSYQISYSTCADHDGDGCTEWGGASSCSPGTSCSEGSDSCVGCGGCTSSVELCYYDDAYDCNTALHCNEWTGKDFCSASESCEIDGSFCGVTGSCTGNTALCVSDDVLCCDDDDNDRWTGMNSAWLSPPCSSTSREKLCSAYAWLGSELTSCDNDPNRNPGIAEICGNAVDEDCDGVVNTCPAVCGDGIINVAGEICDDGNTANGDGCSSTCTVETWWTCDGQSPTTCTECGDGVTDAGEECDDGNTVSADGCSSTCTIESSIQCCDDDDNDLWTGAGPVSSFLGTCTAALNVGREKICSDFSFFGTEGNACDNDASRNPGVAEICGNGIDENCDGVDDVCPPTCVDGIQNGDETGVDCGGSSCSPCPYCGDGGVDAGEICDDGNTANGDGCSSTCTVETWWTCDGQSPTTCTECGDGFIDAGEECDDGNTVSNDGCSSTCTSESSIQCCDDDDNDLWMGSSTVDSFLGTCTAALNAGREKVCSEFSFFGSEINSCDNDASRNPGVAEICGNGIDENCDGVDDVCPPTCVDGLQNGDETGIDCGGSVCDPCPYCGDGNVDSPGEICDDGNGANGDGCSSICTVETWWTCDGQSPTTCTECGDGTIDAGEECDDGNTVSSDGCSSTCTDESSIQCCDDDDNDLWMGQSSTSTFLGTCTNLFTAGREKICSDFSFFGTEGNPCDDDASHNPTVPEICGNAVDENCDGIAEVCPPTCVDGLQNGDETGIDCGGSSCSPCPFCGDGTIDAGEICDDGNFNDGDGCSSICEEEEGWTCDVLSPTNCTRDPRNYWANMNGDEIFVANLGDTVQMIAEGVASGTFNIKEDDPLFDDDIRDVVGSASGVDLVGTWDITSEDLSATSDYEEFYFDAGGRQSGYLEVVLNEDDDPLIVSIEGVVCGSYFDEGSVSEITIVANDADDEIVGSVTIYDVVTPFSNGGITFDQLFDIPGSIQILVEADTIAGDDRKRVISNVMVLDKASGSYVDDTYVAACIGKPADLSNIPGGLVDFDASPTRGVRVVDGTVYELVPGVDAFSWFWTFYPEGMNRSFGYSTNSSAYNFTAVISFAGTNTVELMVEIN